MVSEITSLIAAYKYWAIFPFALFEAPLMSIVVGFFAITSHLNVGLAFGIIVLGDFIGDTALYIFGRWCRPLFGKIGLRLNLSQDRIKKVLDHFGRRDRRAIVISKLVHGVGFTGLIVAGSVAVPYRRFILTCMAVTVTQSAVLAAIGMASGKAYQSFSHVLGYLDAVLAVFTLIGIFILYRMLIEKIGMGKTGD